MKKFIMKKLFGLGLVTILCLFAAACADNAATEKENTENAEESVVESSEETSNEVSEESMEETEEAESTQIQVAALKGPTAMGMVKLMDDSDQGLTDTNQYDFTIAASPDEITPLLVQGKIDIAAVPANLASVLYNNTEGQVKVTAINTLGVLYIVENGDTIQPVEDLKGKTIYASGKGSTPEYVLNYILSSNGIDPDKDVTIEFKSEHAECVAALAENTNGIALLPQPFVTTAQTSNENIRIALDLTEEWNKIQADQETASELITGVIVARTEFIEEHPKALALFLEQYQASVDYVNANNEEAAQLIESYDIIKAAVAEKALPYCNITYIDGTDMEGKLSGYLEILYEQNADAVGGNLPDEAFYYTE